MASSVSWNLVTYLLRTSDVSTEILKCCFAETGEVTRLDVWCSAAHIEGTAYMAELKIRLIFGKILTMKGDIFTDSDMQMNSAVRTGRK